MLKMINLYGGPGTGKSTTAAMVFGELKLRGVNCEYVQEFAKDKAWEFGSTFMRGLNPDIEMPTPKVFLAQDYIFAQQHFRIQRCEGELDLIVTDSPLMLGLAYMPRDYKLPSMRKVIMEAYYLYDNVDILLKRVKPYNPSGRMQTEKEAMLKDIEIKLILDAHGIPYHEVDAGVTAAKKIVDILVKDYNFNIPEMVPWSDD